MSNHQAADATWKKARPSARSVARTYPVSAMAGFELSAVCRGDATFFAMAALDLSLAGPPVIKKGRTRRPGLMTVWSPTSALGSLPNVCPILRVGDAEITTDRSRGPKKGEGSAQV